MAKNKLRRFEELKTFDNVFEPEIGPPGEGAFFLKGKWRSDYFNNDFPLVLELGCGKGEYATGLAASYPGINYIGVDIKGARIWKGAKSALENNLHNVAFLRSRIDFIGLYFGEGEVDEIWLTFPDPQPRKGREKKRLTSPRFLKIYRKLLKPGGVIHLKTDNLQLYQFTRQVIDKHQHKMLDHTDDLYGARLGSLDDEQQKILSIKTYYESMFLEAGCSICYLKFTLD